MSRTYESIGVARRIGSRGRVTLPPAIQEQLHFTEGTMVEFLYDPEHEEVIMKRTDKHTKCKICGEDSDVNVESTPLCKSCILLIKTKY